MDGDRGRWKIKMETKIKNTHYHNLSFQEIDKIRENIISRDLNLYINTTQLYLYLNQMNKKYSLILRWVQNVNILSAIGMIVFLFFRPAISIILLIIFFVTGFSQHKLAMKYIGKQCLEDRVFLKFALAVELAKVSKKPLADPIYKQFKLKQ